MPVRGTPQSIKDKWLRNIQTATPDIQAGIQRVQTAPGVAAAAQVDVWQNNTVAARDKWKRKTAAVSLPDWQASALAGVPRIAQGAQAKQGKMEAHLTNFIPHLEAGQQKLKAMPRGSFEQNLARMIEMARHNKAYRAPGA